MLLKTIDGVPVFATHFIRAVIDREKDHSLNVFQVEADGIVCYSQEEADLVVSKLNEMDIPYTIEPQSPDPALVAKAPGIKYASRTEALEHLLNDKEPESQRLPNLLKRLEQSEAALAVARQEMDGVKARLAAAEVKLIKGVV